LGKELVVHPVKNTPKTKNKPTTNKTFSLYPPQGTGSFPPGKKGLHLKILLTASHPPFFAPYLSIAMIAYSEQVGINRQVGGFNGEMYFL